MGVLSRGGCGVRVPHARKGRGVRCVWPGTCYNLGGGPRCRVGCRVGAGNARVPHVRWGAGGHGAEDGRRVLYVGRGGRAKGVGCKGYMGLLLLTWPLGMLGSFSGWL